MRGTRASSVRALSVLVERRGMARRRAGRARSSRPISPRRRENEFAVARGSRRMDPARLGVSAPELDRPRRDARDARRGGVGLREPSPSARRPPRRCTSAA